MKHLILTAASIALLGGVQAASAENHDHGHNHGDHKHDVKHDHAAHKEAGAHAHLINEAGEDVGHVDIVQGADGVLLHVAVEGLPAGEKGFHIHAVGDCGAHDHGESEAKTDFKAAKGHLTSEGKQHGLLNPEGHHEGDLPNLIVAEDGTAHLETTAHGVTIKGSALSLLDEDGSAIMIHEAADDHKTQPIGGSGARIACGVIIANENAETNEMNEDTDKKEQ